MKLAETLALYADAHRRQQWVKERLVKHGRNRECRGAAAQPRSFARLEYIAICIILLFATSQRAIAADDAGATGGIVVRVVAAQIPPFNSFVLEPTAPAGEPIVVPRTTAWHVGGTTAHVAALPAGRYRMLRLETVGGAFSNVVSLVGSFAEFDVRAGQIVDLGTLILQSIGEGRAIAVPAIGRSPLDLAALRISGSIPAALSGFPAVTWDAAAGWRYQEVSARSSLGGGLVMGAFDSLLAKEAATQPRRVAWNALPDHAAVIERLRDLAELSPPVIDDEGAAWFSASLGQVLRRSPDGEWTRLDTGSVGYLRAITVDGNSVIVGGENGEWRVGSRTDRSWQAQRLPTPGTLVAIVRDASGYLVAVEGFGVTASALHRVTGSDVASAPILRNFGNPAKRMSMDRTRLAAASVGGRLLVMEPVSQVLAVMESNGTWRETRLGGFPFALQSERGSGLSWWLGYRRAGVSRDGGMGWKPAQVSSGTLAFGIDLQGNGLALLSRGGLTSVTYSVSKTADYGRSWATVGPTPAPCLAAHWLPRVHRLLCIAPDGTILATADGIDWRIERQLR